MVFEIISYFRLIFLKTLIYLVFLQKSGLFIEERVMFSVNIGIFAVSGLSKNDKGMYRYKYFGVPTATRTQI